MAGRESTRPGTGPGVARCGHGVWSGSDAAARPAADPQIDRPPTGFGLGRRCDVHSQFIQLELATIAAVVKIPQFPDWQRRGLWEIIHYESPIGSRRLL